MSEIPVVIPCEDASLVGIINIPENCSNVGVVIVVAGGPQYRVGAHRQFVTLARMLADRNVPSIRFDHRGTGDSGGRFRGFVDMNEDIRSAIDTLLEAAPDLDNIVLWGECESASASAFYAYTDPRVSGIFMVNPWIRTEEGEAKTYLKHYYRKRIFEKEFWMKLRSGRFSIKNALKSFFQLLRSSMAKTGAIEGAKTDMYATLPLPERLETCCDIYDGKLFTLTSGKDYIAHEFKDYMAASSIWRDMIASKKMTLKDIEESDHTFTRKVWRDQLFDCTGSWIVDTFAG